MTRRMAVLALAAAGFAAGACAGDGPGLGALKDEVVADYNRFYSTPGVLKIGAGLAVAGVLANSSTDEDVQEWYQEDVHSDGTDDAAKVTKTFGAGLITFPIMAAAYASGAWGDRSPVFETLGEWGDRSVRGLLTGGPLMLALQFGLGASRPSDGNGSDWRPFEDSNGVSGHAFAGAIPFLAAAEMTDNLAGRALWYLGSTLCGLSRVNDDDHYFSQVFLGWGLAYLAVESQDEDRVAPRRVTWFPGAVDGAPALCAAASF